MRYSDDIIEEVRMKNDIVDVVSQYVKLNKRGSTYFGLWGGTEASGRQGRGAASED